MPVVALYCNAWQIDSSCYLYSCADESIRCLEHFKTWKNLPPLILAFSCSKIRSRIVWVRINFSLLCLMELVGMITSLEWVGDFPHAWWRSNSMLRMRTSLHWQHDLTLNLYCLCHDFYWGVSLFEPRTMPLVTFFWTLRLGRTTCSGGALCIGVSLNQWVCPDQLLL